MPPPGPITIVGRKSAAPPATRAPNNAAHRRVGIGLNFIPPHVKVDGPLRCKALLVRGEDRYGNFDLIDLPRAELDEAGIASHAAVNLAYNDNYNIQVQRHVSLYEVG